MGLLPILLVLFLVLSGGNADTSGLIQQIIDLLTGFLGAA